MVLCNLSNRLNCILIRKNPAWIVKVCNNDHLCLFRKKALQTIDIEAEAVFISPRPRDFPSAKHLRGAPHRLIPWLLNNELISLGKQRGEHKEVRLRCSRGGDDIACR